ncbi:MAG: glycosyltransferase [Selenomonadaceae bacterium]|nr:glycosyltransferase [Selenomonadaceae bacterium]
MPTIAQPITHARLLTVSSNKVIRGGGFNLIKLPKNSGSPSVPRNFALNKAHGKYVYFLDADDLLTETALEELFNVAENFDADVVHVEKYIVFKGEAAEVQSFQTGEFVTEPTLETFDIGERVTSFIQKRYVWWACNKLFRRQFLADNKIRFPEVSVFEDMALTFECLVAAKNYVRVPFVSYMYRIRDDSLSHQGRAPIDSCRTAIKIVSALDNFMSGKKFFRANPRYRYSILDFFLQERLEVIAKKFFVYDDSSPDEVFNIFRDKVFSVNPQENIALTSYLFVTASVLKLFSTQQEAEIAKLNHQLSALKKNLEVEN